MGTRIPTNESEGQKVSEIIASASNSVASMRSNFVTWKSQMSVGSVESHLVLTIQQLAHAQSTKMLDWARRAGFYDEYARQVAPYYYIDTANVNTGTDRITNLADNTFSVNDPILFRLIDGTLMTPVVADQRYWVLTQSANTISLSTGPGSTAVVNITAAGTGRAEILFDMRVSWTNLISTSTGALKGVLDEVETMAKVDSTGYHLAYKFDQTQTDGLVYNTYSSTETATLQTRLQEVIDEIRAPA